MSLEALYVSTADITKLIIQLVAKTTYSLQTVQSHRLYVVLMWHYTLTKPAIRLLFTEAGGCVVTHLPLTPTAWVQLPVALSSLTQAIILWWVGEMCSN